MEDKSFGLPAAKNTVWEVIASRTTDRKHGDKQMDNKHIDNKHIDNKHLDNNHIEELKFWYYIDQGEVTGPFSEEEMLAFYRQHNIEDSTEVWKSGMTDWVRLDDSDLAQTEASKQRPKSNEMNHAMSWILALLPILFAGAIMKKSLPLFLILLTLHCIISVMDAAVLIKDGRAKKTTVLWALFLPPVYLVIRAGLSKTQRLSAVIWGLFFVVELFACTVVFDIPALLQPQSKTEVTEPEKVAAVEGITVEAFVKAYIKDPSYEIEESEEGASLFRVKGSMEYEGETAAVVISFQVGADGVVRFKEMAINNQTQTAQVYYNLVDELKSRIDSID